MQNQQTVSFSNAGSTPSPVTNGVCMGTVTNGTCVGTVPSGAAGAMPIQGTVMYLQPVVSPVTRYESYRFRQSVGLGVAQIVLGVLCIVFNGVSIGVSIYGDISVVGHGIWCGVMFIITGAFGVSAGTNKTKCKIITYMVLCIISACFTAAVLSCGIIGTLSARPLDVGSCRYYGYDYYYDYYYRPCTTINPIAAMEGCMAVSGFIAAILFIWGSILCCKAKMPCCNCCYDCCCCSDYPQQQVMQLNAPPSNVNGMQTAGIPYAVHMAPYQQAMVAFPPPYQAATTPTNLVQPVIATSDVAIGFSQSQNADDSSKQLKF